MIAHVTRRYRSHTTPLLPILSAVSVIVGCFCCQFKPGNAFIGGGGGGVIHSNHHVAGKRRQRSQQLLPPPLYVEIDSDVTGMEDHIRSMRVKELKAELTKLRIPTNDVFDKEELVSRLVKARKDGIKPPPSPSSSTSSSSSSSSTLTVPLYFTTMDSSMKIAAVNMDGGIQINPNTQPYATMKIFIQDRSSSSSSSSSFPLHLLVDTACSGFVLRPSVVEDKYQFLPKLSTPVTMTGAGGTVGATGLTQIDRFTLEEEERESTTTTTTTTTFGPLPAAVQDIGALPSSLDGIIGLSFLNQFSKVDFDFREGKLCLQKEQRQASSMKPDYDIDVPGTSLVAEHGALEIVPQLGIYTVDVYFDVDNRKRCGPVKMLVDTGAANSFLSWKGVSDLGLSRDSTPAIKPLDVASAAMGSDNVAMRLTHRLVVDGTMYLGNDGRKNGDDAATSRGLPLSGSQSVSIDIGEIALLEQLKVNGVGGILGIDVLSKCSHAVFYFQGVKKTMKLYNS